jgi:hypothetical protein
MKRWPWITIALFLFVGAMALPRVYGPRPQGKYAPPDEVSGIRGISELRYLMEGRDAELTNRPHPAGSAENGAFRDRLIERLRSLGLVVSEQPFQDGELSLVNVIGYRPGRKTPRPIVLCTHYDSCLWGPGAGDAGSCVAAILEALRVLDVRGVPCAFWVVMTDGEESNGRFGLRGARHLVETKPWPWGEQTPLVINFDARGNRGAVLLYETHENNLAAMQTAGPAIGTPRITSSLMVNVYQRLPNATDYTIFKQAGWMGWNFAIIGGAENYHTPNDSLVNLSDRSVQHFAAHAVGMITALDQLPPEAWSSLEPSVSATFFDLLGTRVVTMPQSTNWIWLAIASGLWLANVRLALRRNEVTWRSLIIAPLRLLAATVVAALIGSAIYFLLSRSEAALPARFMPWGWMLALAMAAISAVSLWLIGTGNRTTSSPRARSLGILSLIVLVSSLCAIFLPGGIYLFVFASIASGIAGLCWKQREDGSLGNTAMIIRQSWSVVPAMIGVPTYLLLMETLPIAASGALAAIASLFLVAITE